MIFYLDDVLKSHFDPRQDLFAQIMALKGHVFRELEGRTTSRVMIDGKSYFLKQHRGVGYLEIIKNLSQGKLPVISAKNEWLALTYLPKIGVRAPKVYGFGARGCNPAYKESFVLLEDIASHESLEDIAKKPIAILEKRVLIRNVADIAKRIHDNGLNHRDFYLCHFLKTADNDNLCLIDLHRALIRKTIPERLRIKDLAGLYFSSKEAGLTNHDLLRFIAHYRGKSIKDILQQQNGFWQKVKERGEKLYRDHQTT